MGKKSLFNSIYKPVFMDKDIEPGIKAYIKAELILFSDNSSGTFRPTEAK